MLSLRDLALVLSRSALTIPARKDINCLNSGIQHNIDHLEGRIDAVFPMYLRRNRSLLHQLSCYNQRGNAHRWLRWRALHGALQHQIAHHFKIMLACKFAILLSARLDKLIFSDSRVLLVVFDWLEHPLLWNHSFKTPSFIFKRSIHWHDGTRTAGI